MIDIVVTYVDDNEEWRKTFNYWKEKETNKKFAAFLNKMLPHKSSFEKEC